MFSIWDYFLHLLYDPIWCIKLWFDWNLNKVMGDYKEMDAADKRNGRPFFYY